MRYEEFIKMTVSDYLKNGSIDVEKFPEFDLYIDQVMTFLDSELSAYLKPDGESVITKAMINNYSKRGVVPRPERKKYSKDHLIMMTMVFYLKGMFQVDQIATMMKPIVDNYHSVLDDKIDIEKIYSIAMNLQSNRRATMLDDIEQEVQKIKKSLIQDDGADDQIIEMFTLILSLALRAESQIFIANSLIEEYFIKPAHEKAEKIKKTKQEKEVERATKTEALKDREKSAVNLLELELDDETL